MVWESNIKNFGEKTQRSSKKRFANFVHDLRWGFGIHSYDSLLMVKLNLPEFDIRLKNEGGKIWIFDFIRRKYLVLTPEEWVRQHFIHYLVGEKQYPKSLLRIEGGLVYNQMQKRSDIVVFDRQGEPWMIVECKSPALAISASTLEQASVYNSTLKAQYLAVTNGLKHLCAHIDWQKRQTTLLANLPAYPDRN